MYGFDTSAEKWDRPVVTIALPILGLPTVRSSPAGAHTSHDLVDAHGRRIRDLRLAVTDRCDLRCTYCLEPDVTFAPSQDRLTVPELVRVASICVSLGVQRLRLTGGEPTLHPQLDELIETLGRLGLEDLAMTTNGRVHQPDRMRRWRDLGLNRLTVSLDTLRPDRFASITRSRAPLDRVLRSIRVARDVGLTPVRVNVVAMRGINDDEIGELGAFARREGIEVRFIEFMPLDAGRHWKADTVVTADEILARLHERVDLNPIGRERSAGTALRYAFADGSPGGVGIIAPVSRPFCGECSRLRITADGHVRSCLFSTEEWDLRALLRRGAPDRDLIAQIADAVHHKKAGHGINTDEFARPTRSMSAIGG